MIEFFDIIKYFQSRDIEYWTHGNNVTKGWVNITCPFCDDQSNHLGINLETKLFHCWRCGQKGLIIRLIQELENKKDVTAIIDEFEEQDIEKPIKKKTSKKLITPALTTTISKIGREYLISRNFDPDYIVNKYHIATTEVVQSPKMTKYKWCLFIPVIRKNRILTYTTRALKKQPIRYLSAKPEESIVPIKNTIYNVDHLYLDKAILVEGIFDAWRLGDNCLACYGTNLTKVQIKILTELNLKKLFILFDFDATKKAEKIQRQLQGLIDEINIIELSEGDPAELSQEDAKTLKREVL